MRLVALLLTTTSVCAQDYTVMLKPLWKSSDKDKDGVLNLEEFKKAAQKLNLKAEIFDLHGKSFDNFYAAINTDANANGLSQKELAGRFASETPTRQGPVYVGRVYSE